MNNIAVFLGYSKVVLDFVVSKYNTALRGVSSTKPSKWKLGS